MATLFVFAPGYFAQIANGMLILIFLYILLTNVRAFIQTNYVTKLSIVSALAIAIGVHGLLHLGLEHVYGYNPLFLFT